jgi:ketol-acid reductoisomerase
MQNNNCVAIIGFGSQAKAWAQNLNDSGLKVSIFLRPESPGHIEVKKLGLKSENLDSPKLSTFSLIALLTPDHTHHDIVESLALRLGPQNTLIFAHGYAQHTHSFQQTFPNLCLALLAPKGIASELRQRKLDKLPLGGVWDLINAPQEQKKKRSEEIQSLGQSLGLTHLYRNSFSEECQADLLSEQSLLCGLIPYAARQSFDLLRSNGVSSELAFMECWMELQLITNALVEKGPVAFFDMISPNALLGADKAQKKLQTQAYPDGLKELWEEIKSGDFTQTCQQSSFDEVRKQVREDWEQTELQQTYEKLKDLVTKK